MSAAGIRVSKHSVLPPIIPESEKAFLESIQHYITSEIENVGCTKEGPAEEYYIIYKNVFERVIEHVKAYKNILTTIKQEYDAFIEAIKKGQRTAFYLHGKLKALACEPSTLMYYKKRIMHLEEKITKIERNSLRTQNLIKKIQNFKTAPESPSPCKKFGPSQAIPGLSHKDSFNMDALTKHLAHLQKRVQELKEDMLTKYVPVENMAVIEEKLNDALNRRDKSEAENVKLKFCYYRLTELTNAVSIWESTDKSVDTLKKIIVQIDRDKCAKKGSLQSSSSVIFEHDATKEKEAEDLIEYIERFNELFSRGQYESAAIFAANCPRGLLRNEETMEKFKAVVKVKGKIPPLLMYCEALVSTSMAVKHPLPENLTAEAIKCALAENRLDLVMYWITQQKLSLSEEAGDAIFAYGEENKLSLSKCLALAQIAYSRCKVHRKAALCLCKQGQIAGAMEYIQQLQHFPIDDYIYLVKNCPTVELIHCLTQEWNGKPAALSLGATMLFLFNMEQRLFGIKLLEDLFKESKGLLEQLIINDAACSVEVWKEIAEICLRYRRIKLSKFLISVLSAQEGVVELPANDDGAKLMEHVFL